MERRRRNAEIIEQQQEYRRLLAEHDRLTAELARELAALHALDQFDAWADRLFAAPHLTPDQKIELWQWQYERRRHEWEWDRGTPRNGNGGAA